MPKYQIILSSDDQVPDDEFLAYVKKRTHPQFKVLSAINLEGIRPETYERDDDVLDLL